MAPEELMRDVPDGFEGAVAGLTIPDVIQMNALNRFSGCITVQFGRNSGSIFFRDGEIIHANQGDNVGETAFYEILQWPGGKFNLQPKVTTTSITIHESWKFLLMESCRLLDENRNKSRIIDQPLEKKTGAATEGSGMSSNISNTLIKIQGVSHAVLLGKDGIPVDDTSYEAENLAAQAVYLAMLGDRLGNIFGVGSVKGAAVQGKESHQLLFEAKNHYLSVAVKGENQLGVVEAEIRKVLSPKK
jgi:predicted regulator of Ras-like GTPase activity (Roadblock/LC7/MglB family)